ncbi:MAG TPA: M14 family zinc carboxypeptidase [Bdellovibrionota bacterium]|nr:M14 family zinc carboxypeptidase [Bdellovibrionota bacterium]
MLVKSGLFYVLMLMALAGSASADLAERGGVDQRPGKQFLSDSGIMGPPYAQIDEHLVQLQRAYPGLATRVVYGMSIGGNPLSMMRIGYTRNRLNSGKAVYVGGSIHGNEYLNIEDRLPEWFLQQARINRSAIAQFLNSGGVIYVVPILNPDGYDKRVRENNNSMDLNRDFTIQWVSHRGYTQPETSELVKYFDQAFARERRRMVLGLDYHCCIGALLYPWSFSRAPAIPAADKARHEAVGKIMQQHLGTDYEYGTTPALLGYDAVGTSKDAYYERYKALAFTFEGQYRTEQLKFAQHTRMWEQIFAEIINAR